MTADEEDDHPAGTRIGRFDVIERLGAGGMGVVYRAHDSSLRRDVALKVLAADLSPEHRKRFVREARSAAAVAHPSIATIFEIGESDGVVFIAMELVPGATLRRFMTGPLEIGEALRIACAVAAGLARAHRVGVVHRDLKPENVMIGPEGEVKILDFGIAKIRSDVTTNEEKLTRDGAIIGTPGYMAPEQASGAPVDARADVFAFGVLLYEMLAGRAAFTGDTVLAVLGAVLTCEPVPIEALRPETPPAIAGFVARCLAKDPLERPSDGAGLLAVLDPDAPISMRPLPNDTDELAPTIAREVPPTRVTRPSAARRWTPLFASLVIVVVALAALAAVIVSTEYEPPAARASTLRPRRLEDLRRITASPADLVVDAPVLGPDGDRLAWSEGNRVFVLDLRTNTRDSYVIEPRVREIQFDGPRALLLLTCGDQASGCALERFDLASRRRAVLREDLVGFARSPVGSNFALRDVEGRLTITRTPSHEGEDVLDAEPSLLVAGIFDASGTLFVKRGLQTVRVAPDGRVDIILDTPRRTAGARTFAPYGEHHWIVALVNWPPEPEGSGLWLLDHRLPPDRILEEGVLLLRLPPGYAIDDLSAARGRIAFRMEQSQTDVWVAQLDGPGVLSDPRRLTADDRHDRGIAWLDASTVLFASDRSGRWQPYSQHVDQRDATPIAAGDGIFTYPIPAPHGGGVLVWRTEPPEPDSARSAVSLVHIRPHGAAGEVIAEAMYDAYYPGGLPGPRYVGARSAGDRCFVGSVRRGVLELREIREGALTLRARVDVAAEAHAVMWDLCHDGRRALVVSHGVHAGGSVEEIDLDRGERRTLARADPGERIQYVGCGARGYWTTSYNVGATGRYSLAWGDGERREVALSSDSDWLAHPAESPDGRRLSFLRAPQDTDVYLLELRELPTD